MGALAVGGMVLVLMGLMILPLAAMSQGQSEAITSWLKNLGPFGLIAAFTLQESIALARWITHKLGVNFAGIERLTVAWLASLYVYVERIGAMTLLWPLELFKVTYWLIWHEIPRMVKALPTAAGRVIHQTVTRVVKVERTIVKLPKLTKAQARTLIGAAVAAYITPYLTMLRWLRSHFHAITAVIPHALPIPFGKTIAGIRARLRRLERHLPATAVAAAVIAVLARLGLGFLRCGNVKKAGKSVCGMNTGLLDSLLLDTVALLSVVSVVEFAKELQTIEGEAVSIFGRLIREFPKT